MIIKKQFEELEAYQGPAVSIYVPTLIAGNYDKNRLRWKNAVSEAKGKLDLPPRKVEELLKPANDITDDPKFWAHQSKGLAGFFGDGYSRIVHLKNSPEELVSNHSDFYLYPLLREIGRPERLFVLALSVNETRFFEAQYDGIYGVDISDIVVDDQDEALQHQQHTESLQHRSVGGGDVAFYANGPGSDMDDVRLSQYFRRVDDGLMEMLYDETAPLIIAGSEGYASQYRAISKYNNVSNHSLTGNPEHLSAVDIHQQLEPVFKDLYQDRLSDFNDRYGNVQSKGLAISDRSDFYHAASVKNVAAVIIGEQLYSELEKAEVERLDDAILLAYRNGADVYFSEDLEGLRAIRRWVMETA